MRGGRRGPPHAPRARPWSDGGEFVAFARTIGLTEHPVIRVVRVVPTILGALGVCSRMMLHACCQDAVDLLRKCDADAAAAWWRHALRSADWISFVSLLGDQPGATPGPSVYRRESAPTPCAHVCGGGGNGATRRPHFGRCPYRTPEGVPATEPSLLRRSFPDRAACKECVAGLIEVDLAMVHLGRLEALYAWGVSALHAFLHVASHRRFRYQLRQSWRDVIPPPRRPPGADGGTPRILDLCQMCGCPSTSSRCRVAAWVWRKESGGCAVVCPRCMQIHKPPSHKGGPRPTIPGREEPEHFHRNPAPAFGQPTFRLGLPGVVG